MPTQIIPINLFEIPFSGTALENIDPDVIGSILSGLSHQKHIGPVKIYRDTPRRVEIQTSKSAAELAGTLALRGLPAIDLKNIRLIGATQEEVLNLLWEIPQSRTAEMSARVRGSTNGSYLRVVK